MSSLQSSVVGAQRPRTPTKTCGNTGTEAQAARQGDCGQQEWASHWKLKNLRSLTEGHCTGCPVGVGTQVGMGWRLKVRTRVSQLPIPGLAVCREFC
jgi:hypothetical protein